MFWGYSRPIGWLLTAALVMVLLTALLIVWGVALQAPIEEPGSAVKTPNPSKAPWYFLGLQEMLVKLAALGDLAFTEEEPANAKSFISGTDKFYLVLNQEIDAEAECAKLKQDLEYQLGFTRSIEAKLSNERFVSGAPAQVVDNERKKLADGLTRIQILRESLAKLGCS